MFFLPSSSSIKSNSTNLLQIHPKKSINVIICSAEKVGVVVKKGVQRPRLVLKFVWMEKNMGLGIDQVVPGGNGTIPLCPYYFWPRKDACEELKAVLKKKPWIPGSQKELLLNQASDIINLWQNSGDSFA